MQTAPATPQSASQHLDRDRKPRIALMGEFSAGKSSLTNLLLGQRPLPVQVTATRLPPVWITHGEEAAEWVDHAGQSHPLSLSDLPAAAAKGAAFIRLHLPCETLELCDLIDTPGISDPNMPSDLWQGLLPEIDGLLWCTPAMQAWRQSEAAFWASIAPQLRGPATLLLTHCDKLLGSRDQARVLRRLHRETGEDFSAIFPLSLTRALDASEDLEAWQDSGADRFVEHLVNLLLHWRSDAPHQAQHADMGAACEEQANVDPGCLDPGPETAVPVSGPKTAQAPAVAADAGRILPRRVRPNARNSTDTPRAPRPHLFGQDSARRQKADSGTPPLPL